MFDELQASKPDKLSLLKKLTKVSAKHTQEIVQNIENFLTICRIHYLKLNFLRVDEGGLQNDSLKPTRETHQAILGKKIAGF